MAKKSERKLFLFGRYSLALLLPKKWLRDLGADRGEAVELEYNHAKRRIIVKFNNSSNSTTEPPKTAQPKPTKSNPDKATNLEPIPEI